MGSRHREAVRLQAAAGIVSVEIEHIQSSAKVRESIAPGKVQTQKILSIWAVGRLEINDSKRNNLSLVRKTAKAGIIYENFLD